MSRLMRTLALFAYGLQALLLVQSSEIRDRDFRRQSFRERLRQEPRNSPAKQEIRRKAWIPEDQIINEVPSLSKRAKDTHSEAPSMNKRGKYDHPQAPSMSKRTKDDHPQAPSMSKRTKEDSPLSHIAPIANPKMDTDPYHQHEVLKKTYDRRMSHAEQRISAQQEERGSRQRPRQFQDQGRQDQGTFPLGAEADERQSRLLNIFTLIRFQNLACNSTSGDNGTCYTQSQCEQLGGTPTGTCAGGFGVCCVFYRTCGQNTNINCTYFVNTGYPGTFDGVTSCQLTVTKCDPSVCQLRLDYVDMQLSNPTSGGSCVNDQFIVSGGNNIPSVCGTNSGNHVYVDVDSTVSTSVLTVVTSGASFGRSFKVKITQIPCGSGSGAAGNTAPSGCLQYYTGASGRFTSYNYNNAQGQELANQDYSICIRMESGFCGIQYSACPDPLHNNTQSFSLSGRVSDVPNQQPNSQAGFQQCNTDWITVPCLSDVSGSDRLSIPPNNGQICQDRLCGTAFNAIMGQNAPTPLYSSAKPFIFHYHTSPDELDFGGGNQDMNNRGFCIDYVQQPCA